MYPLLKFNSPCLEFCYLPMEVRLSSLGHCFEAGLVDYEYITETFFIFLSSSVSVVSLVGQQRAMPKIPQVFLARM